ncbi:hypothetical protein PG995_010879 [Apiospora arundinis]
MTNINGLTTAFTPSSGYLQTIWGQVFTEHHGSNSATHKYHSLGRSATSDCYPLGFQLQPDAFYSPGICPSGWVIACSSLDAINTLTETRATCCPRGYSCITPPGTEVTWSTLSCTSIAISSIDVIVPNVDNQQEKTTTLAGVEIQAGAINTRWQKSDFLPAATTTGSILPTETGGGKAEGSSTPDSGASSLSTAARAGIGTGIGVGALLVLGSVAFAMYRRRKQKKLEEAAAEKKMPGHMEPGTSDGSNLPGVYFGQEVIGQNEQEMPTRDHMLEMNGYSGPTELHAFGRVAQ